MIYNSVFCVYNIESDVKYSIYTIQFILEVRLSNLANREFTSKTGNQIS